MRNSGSLLRVASLLLLVGSGAAGVGRAQTAISVTDTTGWNPWTTDGSTVMTDAPDDQQTGQGQDDFVGDATYYAFAQKAGTIGGTDHIAFQARMNTYSNKGFAGMLSTGIDLDGDGDLDLMMQADAKSSTKGVRFAAPGTDLNNSPSTSSWGTWSTPTGTMVFDSSDYSYAQTTLSNFDATPDALVTFAVSFADLQWGIRTYATSIPNYTTFTLSYTTKMSFVGFTTTQGNSINQDMAGAPQISSGTTTTFAQLGGITPLQDAYGIVPEPSTYAQVGALLSVGALVWWRRRKGQPAGKAGRARG